MHACEETTSANEAAQFSWGWVSATPQAMRDSLTTRMVLALHFSSLKLCHDRRTQYLAMAMDRHQVSCDLIGFKLMETPLIDRMAIQLRRAFRKPSLPLSTGYSSLVCLRCFSIPSLKIARRFVSGIAVNPSTCKIARLIGEVAHRLNLCCIAEDIEAEEQQCLVRALEGNELQSILLIPPMEVQITFSLLAGCLSWIGLTNRMSDRMSDADKSIDPNQTRWPAHHRNSAQEHLAGSWGELVVSGDSMEGRALCTTG